MQCNRWVILGGSFLAYLFDALEILLLSLALPAIRLELGISVTQAGLLATATLLGIGVSSVVAGYVADNFGRKTALVGSLATFGLLTASLYFVPNFEVFLVLRFLAGLGLGGVWGVVSAYVVETWPNESRGRAAAFVLSSFPIGGAVAAVLSGFLLPDWRFMFLVTGSSVIVPLLIVVVFFEESPVWADHRASRTDSDKRVSVVYILNGPLRRTTILGTAMAGLALTGFWGASTWLPTYLTTERGLDKASVGTFIAVLNLGMFIGYNVFGVIADRLGRRTAILMSLLGVTVTLPVYAVTSHQTALLWLGPAFAFFAAFFGLFGSYLGELFPTRARATGAGFCFNLGRGISAFAPFALAGLASSIGFSGGLIVCAVFFGLSSIVTLLLPRTGYAEPEPATRAEANTSS